MNDDFVTVIDSWLHNHFDDVTYYENGHFVVNIDTAKHSVFIFVYDDCVSYKCYNEVLYGELYYNSPSFFDDLINIIGVEYVKRTLA